MSARPKRKNECHRESVGNLYLPFQLPKQLARSLAVVAMAAPDSYSAPSTDVLILTGGSATAERSQVNLSDAFTASEPRASHLQMSA
jgi:hypothetical protein